MVTVLEDIRNLHDLANYNLDQLGADSPFGYWVTILREVLPTDGLAELYNSLKDKYEGDTRAELDEDDLAKIREIKMDRPCEYEVGAMENIISVSRFEYALGASMKAILDDIGNVLESRREMDSSEISASIKRLVMTYRMDAENKEIFVSMVDPQDYLGEPFNYRITIRPRN